jgi:hypothetical protein
MSRGKIHPATAGLSSSCATNLSRPGEGEVQQSAGRFATRIV